MRTAACSGVKKRVLLSDSAGMDEDARRRWHTEFERRAPDGHQEFLLSLGIAGDEVERIQRWSRGEMDQY